MTCGGTPTLAAQSHRRRKPVQRGRDRARRTTIALVGLCGRHGREGTLRRCRPTPVADRDVPEPIRRARQARPPRRARSSARSTTRSGSGATRSASSSRRSWTSPTTGSGSPSSGSASRRSSSSSRPTTRTGVARFLANKGEGFHHVCFEVANLAETLLRLEIDGLELIDSAPRRGAEGPVAFLHPRSCHGVLVELIEAPGGPAWASLGY